MIHRSTILTKKIYKNTPFSLRMDIGNTPIFNLEPVNAEIVQVDNITHMETSDPINSSPDADAIPFETVTLPQATLDALKTQVDSLNGELRTLTSSRAHSDALMAQLIKDNEVLRIQGQVPATNMNSGPMGGNAAPGPDTNHSLTV